MKKEIEFIDKLRKALKVSEAEVTALRSEKERQGKKLKNFILVEIAMRIANLKIHHRTEWTVKEVESIRNYIQGLKL